MTFNDFLKTHKVNRYVLSDVKHHCLSDEDIKLLSDVWNAALESVMVKLVRGTNLYNISGDHITHLVISSLEQLKAS